MIVVEVVVLLLVFCDDFGLGAAAAAAAPAVAEGDEGAAAVDAMVMPCRVSAVNTEKPLLHLIHGPDTGKK